MSNKLTMIYNKTAATYNRMQVHREERHADRTTNAQIQIHREDRYADCTTNTPTTKTPSPQHVDRKTIGVSHYCSATYVPYINLAEEIKSHR
jgi:hypothetical protein